MRMADGRFSLTQKPGLGFELTEASLAKYPYAGTRPMERVFHEDGMGSRVVVIESVRLSLFL